MPVFLVYRSGSIIARLFTVAGKGLVRITYLHQYYNSPNRPGSTRSYEIAKRLVQAGHSVHVVTSDRSGSGSSYESIEDGIRVTWIPVAYSNNMGTSSRLKAFLNFAVRSARIAVRSNPDVIFATSTPLTIALPAIWTKWRLQIPMVFEVRDLWPEVPIALGHLRNPVIRLAASLLERAAYSNSARIVAASPGMAEGILKTGYPKEKITVVPNSCDFDRFEVDPVIGQRFRAERNWLGNRPLVLYAGTLGEVNGVDYLVRVAAKALKMDEEIRFLVIGAGKEEKSIRALAAELGVLERNFYMLPEVPKEQVPVALSAATITTSTVVDIPALWNNSANKFFDSLASSRPIAINHEGWLADLLRNYDAGIVLDPNDHERAASRLVSVLRDDKWLVGARQRAGDLGRTQFSREVLFSKWLRAVEEAVTPPQ